MAFTYFFRDMQTLELIATCALPVLKGYRHIDIWDAGCAHGPEPYSVAIVLRENMGTFMFRNVRIFATDIDASNRFEKIIEGGVYPEGEIKRIPPAFRERYFSETSRAGYYKLVDEIRASVSFSRQNLLSLKPVRSGLGLIVCKNVLLHFNSEQRVNVIRMFHGALREGGFLVTEQTQKLPVEMEGLFQRVAREGQIFKKTEVDASVTLENAAC